MNVIEGGCFLAIPFFCFFSLGFMVKLSYGIARDGAKRR